MIELLRMKVAVLSKWAAYTIVIIANGFALWQQEHALTATDVWRGAFAGALSIISFLLIVVYRGLDSRIKANATNITKYNELAERTSEDLRGQIRKTEDGLIEVRTMLLGIDRQGGLVERIEAIHATLHDLRNKVQEYRIRAMKGKFTIEEDKIE